MKIDKWYIIGGIGLIGLIFWLFKKPKKQNPIAEKVIEENKISGSKEYIIGLVQNENLGAVLKVSDVLAIIEKESSFDPNAKQGQYIGLFQLGKLACKDIGFDYDSLKNNVEIQVKAGVQWLKKCLQYGSGDIEKAVKIHRVGVGCVNSGYDQNVCTIDNAREIAENYYKHFLTVKTKYLSYDE